MKVTPQSTTLSQLSGCISAATVCGVVSLAGCASTCHHPAPYEPDDYTESARHSLRRSFEAQANNGHVLEQTMWNHHFDQDSEELRPSGRAFLDRIANHYPLRCSGLYLQTAHDISLTSGRDDTRTPAEKVQGYFTRRQELDALRMKSISEYLQYVSPGNTLMVQIHDKPPVGLPSDEAGRAYILMARKAPQGLLPSDVTASRFSFGGSSNGGGDFGGGFGGGGGFGDPGAFGGGSALPQALSGAQPADTGLPDFSSQTPTSGEGNISGPSGN